MPDSDECVITFPVLGGIFGVGRLATRLNELANAGQIGSWRVGQWTDSKRTAIGIRFGTVADGEVARRACIAAVSQATVDAEATAASDQQPASTTSLGKLDSPAGSSNEITSTPQGQIRQLIKQALDNPSAAGLEEFLVFTTRFRRLAVWNARMAYIQRPGARVIASEYEWAGVGRYVLPDAVPIIILWPFSPIRFVYELADTGPPINRDDFHDPFAVKGELDERTLPRLETSLTKQKTFKIEIELRRQGFNHAGSAASQGVLPLAGSTGISPRDDRPIGEFAHENAMGSRLQPNAPVFRITINDRLEQKERFVTLAHELGHIFCGHLGGCTAPGRQDDESGWPDRRNLGKDEKEIEAEAAAFLVASRAGVMTRSAEYLKLHAKTADMTSVDEDLIVRAAARIERLAKIHYGTMSFKQ